MDEKLAPPLTQTMISVLIRYSPMHAWWTNPLLNPEYKEEPSTEMDFGKIVHAILLEGDDVTVVLDYPDYRTDKSREERDAIRLTRKIPILAKYKARVNDMVAAARANLPLFRDIRGGFVGGFAEHRIEWIDPETGVRCKARLDYLQGDYKVILDYKTTTASANPETLSRSLFDRCWDIQACFYAQGVAEVCKVPEPETYFIVQEVNPPYALSVIGLGPEAKWFGKRRCEEGLRIWQKCISSGVWPGYGFQTAWAKLPPWLESRQIEKEMRDAL